MYKSVGKEEVFYNTRSTNIHVFFDAHLPIYKGPVNIYWGVGIGAFQIFNVKKVYVPSWEKTNRKYYAEVEKS